MTGSLKDLPTFVPAQHVRYLADAIPAEQVVLAQYTFVPYVRTGVAAVLNQPFDWSLPIRATVELTVPVVDGAGTDAAAVAVQVRGPADVAAIDASQVIRCYPRPSSAAALVEDLAHIEFDRPDLPWMFTPAGPPADNRLVPWICLVVVPVPDHQASPIAPGTADGLPQLHTTRAELPPLSDAWAWAHAQVMGPRGDVPSIENRLSAANPTINLSRLLCPRRLEPQTSYVACVVPTFQAGREAGLGLPVDTNTLAPAWNDDDASDTEITLPVYYSFAFATGEPGDFRALAERLVPQSAPPGVGRRTLDTSEPGGGVPPIANGPGREMIVDGPVVSLASTEGDPQWPSPVDQVWPAEQQTALRDRLNARQNQAHQIDPETHPTVGPPLYANAHINHDAVDAQAPGWFAELNGDPRNRVVAGLGTRVVQNDQEALMASAWNQVAGVEAANAALRNTQLGRYIGASIHARHIMPLTAPTLLTLTTPGHRRLRQPDTRTVQAHVDVSSLPLGVTSGAFRRLLRPRGPVARFAATALADRPLKVSALTADASELTKDYVRPYGNPDGIDSITVVARPLLTPELVSHAWGFNGDNATVLTARATMLTKPSVTDAVIDNVADRLAPDAAIRPSTAPAAVLERLLLALPPNESITSDRSAAEVTRTLMSQIAAVRQQANHFVLPSSVSGRAALTGRAIAARDKLVFVDWTSVEGSVASGSLGAVTVTFTGLLQAVPASRIDGTEVAFSNPGFDPPLPHSDAIGFESQPAVSGGGMFRIDFSAPVTDPILYLGSVASTLRFDIGTPLTRISGQEGFHVDGTVVTGEATTGPPPGALSDSSGVVQVPGTHTEIVFTAEANETPGGTFPELDGMYFHLCAHLSELTVIEPAEVDSLVGRLGELTAPHQLGELYDDRQTAERVGQLVSAWAHPPPASLVPALKRLADRLISPGGPVDDPRDRIHIPDLSLAAALDPRVTVTRRVRSRLTTWPSWLPGTWFDNQRIEPIMAAPHFEHPMYEALDRYDRRWLIPGVDRILGNEFVTVLQTNSRFVEAFLVGLNHEFARELLWRQYPTDGRGTYFSSFWTTGSELVNDIDAFSGQQPLGGHVAAVLLGRLVLLVRGELARRYPGLIANAVQHSSLDDGRPLFGAGPAVATTLFQVNLQPDLLLVGFDLTRAQVDEADTDPAGPIPGTGAYWFLLAENPTEPRFGLHEGNPIFGPRDDVTWSALLPPSATFLRPGVPANISIEDGPPPPPLPAVVVPVPWGEDAAKVAHILYNPPSRAAFRAATMLKEIP
jgi:hypothetical protein